MYRKPMRESYIPKNSTKVCDKKSDAVAYVYDCESGKCGAAVFYGKQARPYSHTLYRDAARLEADIARLFAGRQLTLGTRATWAAERKAKAEAFRAEIEVGDIFHYSYGYDETHHVFYEVVAIAGRYATVRKIRQAQQDLGYDWRHRCMPQSGDYCGPETRVLIQDGRIKVDHHYHASKWNTATVAGVKIGPSYTGGGAH